MIITVVAEHHVEVAPERGTVRVTAQTESDERGAALEALQDALTGLVADLDDLGRRDPSPLVRRVVESPRTNSWFEQLPNATRVAHHNAYAQVRAEFDDLAVLDEHVAAWGSREALSVDGVEWTLTKDTQDRLEQEVLTAVVSRARQRALVLATAAGHGDVQLVELADPGLLSRGIGEGDAMGAAAMMSRSQKAHLASEPDSITVSAQVHARFETL